MNNYYMSVYSFVIESLMKHKIFNSWLAAKWDLISYKNLLCIAVVLILKE